MKAYENKDKLINCLKSGKIKLWNRYRKLLYEFGIYKIDLRGIDLRNANLRSAKLHGANLLGAILRGADLIGANLSYTDLRGAKLQSTNLRNADLYRANLRSAKLHGANLQNSNLHGANLRNANLSYKIIKISGFGSIGRETIYKTGVNEINCGCFTGTLKKFIKKIKKTYGKEEEHYKDYANLVQLLFKYK